MYIRVFLLLIVIIVSLGVHISMNDLETKKKKVIDGFMNMNAATNLIALNHQAQKMKNI